MRCWYCGKPFKHNDDTTTGWHPKCVKDFFGTSKIPEISLSKNELEALANKTVNKGLTVPGVQKKLSLHLSRDKGEARFTLVDYPTGYILKPQSADFKQLPEAEHLAMSMAKEVGIAVVPFSLLRFNNEYAYITRRIDRTDKTKLAMEDFCQLSGRSTADKYKGSYETCGKIITKYSKRGGFDITEFYLRLVFCHIIGNSDMHLKNFSLIETEPGNRNYVLSAAYDLLPVNIIMPSDKDFTGLTLNGKKRNLRRNDFLALAESIGINPKVAHNIIKMVISKINACDNLIDESFVSEEFKNGFRTLISERIEYLK